MIAKIRQLQLAGLNHSEDCQKQSRSPQRGVEGEEGAQVCQNSSGKLNNIIEPFISRVWGNTSQGDWWSPAFIFWETF